MSKDTQNDRLFLAFGRIYFEKTVMNQLLNIRNRLFHQQIRAFHHYVNFFFN